MITKQVNRNKPFSIIVLLLFALLLTTTSSCNRKGCTDPKANNYNSKSKTEDNSCEYDSENFIRSYQMVENCGGSFTYPMVISAHSDLSYVLLENFGGWVNEVNLPALVDGTTLSFDDTINGIRFIGTGSIVTDTNVLSLEYQSFDSEGEEISSCTSVSS